MKINKWKIIKSIIISKLRKKAIKTIVFIIVIEVFGKEISTAETISKIVKQIFTISWTIYDIKKMGLIKFFKNKILLIRKDGLNRTTLMKNVF